jgi:hypothetical protein
VLIYRAEGLSGPDAERLAGKIIGVGHLIGPHVS